MDCFHDFCLSCDKQCVDGPYCSQACRLADLERGNASVPTTPLTTSTPNVDRLSWASSSSSTSPSSKRSSIPSQSDATLTPSSSRTSLTSTSSSSGSATYLTQQARLELQDYFSSFDQTRAAKRRPSLR